MSPSVAPEALERERGIIEMPRRSKSGESLSALMLREFPPIKWIVPDIMPEGLTLLAGPSKLGKSWLALEICLAVGFGGAVLDKTVVGGDVLYWALEDGARRIQSRVKQLQPCDDYSDCRLTLRTLEDLPPPLDAGGLKELQRWADNVDQPRLIVIDVLAKVKPDRKGNDSEYDAIYKGLRDIHAFAVERDIGVLVVHHTRKGTSDGDPFDKVSGTRAFTALPDATLVLDRDPAGWCDAVLYGRGRDLEEFEISLDRCENGQWQVLHDVEAAKRSDARNKVLGAFLPGEEWGVKDVAQRAAINEQYAYKLCARMAASGELKKVGAGRYRLP